MDEQKEKQTKELLEVLEKALRSEAVDHDNNKAKSKT